MTSAILRYVWDVFWIILRQTHVTRYHRVWANHLEALVRLCHAWSSSIFVCLRHRRRYGTRSTTSCKETVRRPVEPAPPKTFRATVRLSYWLHGPVEDFSSQSRMQTWSKARARRCRHHCNWMVVLQSASIMLSGDAAVVSLRRGFCSKTLFFIMLSGDANFKVCCSNWTTEGKFLAPCYP